MKQPSPHGGEGGRGEARPDEGRSNDAHRDDFSARYCPHPAASFGGHPLPTGRGLSYGNIGGGGGFEKPETR